MSAARIEAPKCILPAFGIIGTAVVNLVINVALAWVTVRGEASVPVWSLPVVGDPSTAVDTVGTLFFLPLFTSLFCTAAVRRELRSGTLEPLAWPHVGTLDRLTGGRLRRGLVLVGLCTALLAPLVIGILLGVHFDDVSRSEFIIFKAAFAVMLGAAVTPLIAVRAMAEAGD